MTSYLSNSWRISHQLTMSLRWPSLVFCLISCFLASWTPLLHFGVYESSFIFLHCFVWAYSAFWTTRPLEAIILSLSWIRCTFLSFSSFNPETSGQTRTRSYFWSRWFSCCLICLSSGYSFTTLSSYLVSCLSSQCQSPNQGYQGA